MKRCFCFACLSSLANLIASGMILLAGSILAGTYPRLESPFYIPGLATDPFDYEATDIKVTWRLPDGSSLVVPAFFDGGTTWRVRHTPTMAGEYEITAIALNGTPLLNGSSETRWVVSGAPTGAGFIRIDPADPMRFVTDDGRGYFPVGHNVCWNPSVSNDFPRIFSRMGAARENWTRIWMTHFYESLNLDWPKVGGAFGQLNLTVARRWDLMVSEAEKAGIAMQVVFQHHGQYSTRVNPNWNDNPYNTAKGGFLSDPRDFFTDPTAKALTKRKLRYAIARWGYSRAIMAWELWNEVQFTDAADAGEWANIAAWHDEMAAFLRAQDPYGHLVTTSSELTKEYWSSMDYYQNHNYAGDTLNSSRDGNRPPSQWPAKPNFDGESGGVTSPPRLWVQPLLWGSLMSTQAGASCPWWWDTIDPENGYFLFKSARDFVSLSGLADQNGLVKSVPGVTGVLLSPLVFGPGGSWAPVTQDVFTVGDSAPDGIGSAPPYLHGRWHHQDMNMPNGYTFLVDYGEPGTFSVQVRETSTYGDSNLRMALDGVTKTNVTFLSSQGGPTNATFTIAVPAGSHSILLTNGALDWLVLGGITLNPYVPMLGSYAVGNTNFQCAWVWHRTNLFATNAGASLSGAFKLKNLESGAYAATWWDAFNGGFLTNFSLSVPTDGAEVSLPTPSVLRSAALVVGKPAVASLNTTSLSQTLATNAAPVYTAVMLTNSGGLPLHYTLSLTGLSSLAYAWSISGQEGGTGYVWRDVSAIGQDLGSSFTALAAPKSARDEGITGPIDMGFEFPFFSGEQSPGVYSQVYISPNGFLTFSPFAGDRSGNVSLPDVSAPTNMIALFWDDLDLSTGGKVYAASDPLAGEFTVQYDAVRFKNSALTVTAQVVLRSTGEVLCYYKSIGRTNSCTVGVQNAAGNEGLEVSFNTSDVLQSGMALKLMPAVWLQFEHPAGFVPPGAVEPLHLAFRANDVAAGLHSATLVLKTSDPAMPISLLPVTLSVPAGSSIAQWRWDYFGTTENNGDAANEADVDGDKLINVFEYGLGTNPTNTNASPVQFSLQEDHLRLQFTRPSPPAPDLTFLVEACEDLAAPVWHSGPVYTSQLVTPNGDGTETVIITDLAPVSETPTHYLRLSVQLAP